MSDTTSEYAELLHELDALSNEFASYVRPDPAYCAERAASAIRALEAKVQRLSYPRAWMTCKTHGTPDARAWGCPQCVDELRADRDRLAAENAALRADSERYRYIQRFLKNPVLLDAAIDAARGAGDQ